MPKKAIVFFILPHGAHGVHSAAWDAHAAARSVPLRAYTAETLPTPVPFNAGTSKQRWVTALAKQAGTRTGAELERNKGLRLHFISFLLITEE